MFVDGRTQQAHVTFYRGRIHCLEFKKPLKFYEGKDVSFGAVTEGNPKQSYTGAIDRYEHGKMAISRRVRKTWVELCVPPIVFPKLLPTRYRRHIAADGHTVCGL